MAESNETRTTNSALSEDPWMELQRVWDNETDVEREEMDEVRLLALRLHRLRKPSIAAINGAAIGLGMGLALGCDIRLASENATFSERFVNMGLIPADGSCWHLPRLIGLGNAYLMQYTGDIVTADEAFRMGLVSRVTMHEDLMGVSTQLAKQLAGGATYSMGIIKRLVQRSLETNLEESFDLAGSAQSLARKTTDHKEGVRAFLEKRRPKFRGR
jgi:2-(1,2-epoxy-1,2-dihydrophenyl)acetyl-CoA isomerase